MTVHKKFTKRHRIIAKSEGWISVLTNILLFGFKFWVGYISGSVAIIADAWHSLSDSMTSVILLFGIKMSEKPADKEHPFGHGRSELISTLVIAILLAVVAFQFICKSIARLHMHESAEYGSLALWAMIITIVSKEAMAQYAFWAGKLTGMNSLKADAWHHRSDAVSSVIILAGIIFGAKYWWVDGVMGLIVALIIMYAAYDVLKSAIGPLLGRCPDKEMIEQVAEICKKHGGDKIDVHHLHIHDYGNHTELTFHIHLDGTLPLDKAHAVSKQIEFDLLKEMGISATIHMEPQIK